MQAGKMAISAVVNAMAMLFFAQGNAVADTKLEMGWRFVKHQDAMTDANRSYFAKDQSNGSLTFKCFGYGRYEPIWIFGKYLTSRATFLYRFDKNPPISVDSGQLANTHRALFLDDEKEFEEKMRNSQTLTLQARDRDGDVITQMFHVEGFANARSYAEKAAPCGRDR